MRLCLGLALTTLLACGPPATGGSTGTTDDAKAPVQADGGLVDETSAMEDAAGTVDAPEDVRADVTHDAGKPHDAAPDGPACIKEITVLFSVGTGAGSLASHASGCWTVIDADGAANHAYRKCSTGSGVVQNPGAPNYAFDDTNPNDPLAEQQGFLQQCSAGATGDGWEYMAYRGGWRLLFPATHLRAFFAELHASDDDVDDNWPGAYVGNPQLAHHTVYPMINIGPRGVAHPETTIENDGLAICRTIRDHGYFGVYVATWNEPMPDGDPRIVALAKALDGCTKK